MTLNWLDRVWLQMSPRRAVDRIRARAIAQTLQRHYEAAQGGRRTEHWKKVASDANSANAAIGTLRNISRDLVRNNGWARNAKRVVTRHAIGWGIVPTPMQAGLRAGNRARALWRRWADTPQCDARGQLNIYGLQRLAMRTVVESGEVLVRRYRRSDPRLAIPLQLQVLEPDHLDTTRDGLRTANGGRIIQGVEFDADGRRVAYWLLPEHPGASYQLGVSRSFGPSVRVPAEDVLHVYDVDRAGQVRGVPWFAAAIVKLKEFDEFEDAQLLRQKIAACLAVFVTDIDGGGLAVGEEDTTKDPKIETIEPGTIVRLPMGREVKATDPPQVVEGGFTERTLRGIAAGIGVTYEDLVGDFSQVNFSSARMSRLAHWANVYDWQWNMVIPMFCVPVWTWAMEAALIAGAIAETPASDWTTQPMPIIDPDKEALANIRRIRGGQATFSQVFRELGLDPDTQFEEYAADLERLDDLGIKLDSDPRYTTQAGNPVQGTSSGSSGDGTPAEE